MDFFCFWSSESNKRTRLEVNKNVTLQTPRASFLFGFIWGLGDLNSNFAAAAGSIVVFLPSSVE
jgi:hypothetical protein